MAHAIEVHGLRKNFGDVVALDGIDLHVRTGEIHGLLGPNGAGKSTLLRILFGLVQADEGTVEIFGREHQVEGSVLTLAGVAGFVDRPHFYPYLTARQTLQMLVKADGIGGDDGIEDVLAMTGIADAAGRKVRGWSTGMRQRLGVACALIRHPRLLVLDEPTEGLDPSGSRELMDLLRAVAADGVTVLLSSHDMSEVDAACDSATILCRGKVVQDGSLSELRSAAPASRHRLTTTDDHAATLIAQRYPVSLEPHPRGGLSLAAEPTALHQFICEMGRRDVSVTLLELEIDPLTALFYELTVPSVEKVGTA